MNTHSTIAYNTSETNVKFIILTEIQEFAIGLKKILYRERKEKEK